MPRRYKVALFIFFIVLIGIMSLACKIRGDFGVGTEVLIPVFGICIWFIHDNTIIRNPKPRNDNDLFRVIK